MMIDIVDVRVTGPTSVWLRFDNGYAGEIDLGEVISFKGVFEPLKDPAEFARVTVNSDIGTVVWPNGADLAPDVLYWRMTGQPIPGEDPA